MKSDCIQHHFEGLAMRLLKEHCDLTNLSRKSVTGLLSVRLNIQEGETHSVEHKKDNHNSRARHSVRKGGFESEEKGQSLTPMLESGCPIWDFSF